MPSTSTTFPSTPGSTRPPPADGYRQQRSCNCHDLLLRHVDSGQGLVRACERDGERSCSRQSRRQKRATATATNTDTDTDSTATDTGGLVRALLINQKLALGWRQFQSAQFCNCSPMTIINQTTLRWCSPLFAMPQLLGFFPRSRHRHRSRGRSWLLPYHPTREEALEATKP